MPRILSITIILFFIITACQTNPPAETATTASPIAEAAATATAVPPTNTPPVTPTAGPEPPPPTSISQDDGDSTPSLSFHDNVAESLTLLSETPVVSHQANGRYVNPGAVIFHEGQYHMLNNEFSTWPGDTRTYYYTSTDGLTWTQATAEPVFTSDQVDISGRAVLILSGFVEDDGTWVVYFHTFSSNATKGYIGRATADNPLGPWTADPEPVLSPGGNGEWDDTHVMRANVLKTGDTYVMIYAGTSGAGSSQIGYATSPDGRSWTKYDDPTTSEAPYAESDPILQPEADWERTWLGRPEVVQTEAGWVMLYEGGGNSRTGLAVSQDGRHWDRYPQNPLFTQSDSVNQDTFFQGELHYHDGLFRYYLEVGPGSQTTDIYLWTFPSPLAGADAAVSTAPMATAVPLASMIPFTNRAWPSSRMQLTSPKFMGPTPILT